MIESIIGFDQTDCISAIGYLCTADQIAMSDSYFDIVKLIISELYKRSEIENF